MLGNPSYPTYQAFLALGIAAVIALALMPLWIRILKFEGIGQQVRADGPERHLVKQGTPTMGGVIILISIVVTCLLMGKLTTELVLVLLATVAYGAPRPHRRRDLGDARALARPHAAREDDRPHAHLRTVLPVFRELVRRGAHRALPGGFAIDLGVLTTTLDLGGQAFSIPWLYVAFTWLLIAGLSNAVNLTDGLDGLAGGTSMIALLIMAAVTFLCNDPNLTVFCTSCAGACLGFLWFNCYPASIFMGDTGSLALGAALAAVAVMTNTEVVSLIVGGLFIIEALSVMIQVVSFKATGKRVFLMAPIHHHFEKMGWAETKVVIRFWIVSAAFGALGLALFFQLG